MEEWLHGISLVRKDMHTVEMLRLMHDSLNTIPLKLEPIQLPYIANDSWFGAEFPESTHPVHDTLSMVLINPQEFSATRAQCGLLIDSWVESIPNREEVTGISFNYNQPNSQPPQSILLAVSPTLTGAWSWDDLVATVLDTFKRAEMRAIEPEHIEKIPGLGALLPATIGEFSTTRNSISLDLSLIVAEVATKVATMEMKIG
jgi:hypothetical protein